MNTVGINIADFGIEIKSNQKIVLEEGYTSFIKEISTIDCTVYCYDFLPENPFYTLQPAFEAENQEQKFYSIYQLPDNRLGFLIYNQRGDSEIQQVAYLSSDFKNWEIYSRTVAADTINPLRYPMGPIIMYYLTVKTEAVLIHASCINDGEKGRIFSGFSGNGKSTMSGIWADQGFQVINDDRLIIRKMDEEYVVYNTPMYYEDEPKKSGLDSVFLISHSPENKINKLSGAIAVTRVLAFCIQNNFNSAFVSNNLTFLTQMCKKVQVYELGFVPDKNVIDFVKKNEN